MAGVSEIFGDLGQDPRFLAPVTSALARLIADGSRATIAYYARGGRAAASAKAGRA
jgi:hypothetical protein